MRMDSEDEQKCFGVKIDFLNKNKILQITQKSKRGNVIYDNYCESLENYFLSYKSIYDNMCDSLKVKPHEKIIFIKEFKAFLTEWNTILKDVSSFQIEYLTQIRTVRDQNLEQASDAFTEKIQTFVQPQILYREKQANFLALLDGIQDNFSQFRKEAKEPSIYYNQKLTQSRKKNIIDDISKVKQSQKQMTKQIKQIANNAEQYEKYLVHYRKRLFTNKYSYLQKLNKMSTRSNECLIQLIILLYKSATTRHEIFKNLVKNQPADKNKLKRTNKSIDLVQEDHVSTQIILMTQQFNLILDQLSSIINNIIDSLAKISTNGKVQYEKSKSTFIQNLNKLYDIEESPSTQVVDSLDLFNFFTQKMADMIDKLSFCYQDLAKLRQNVKKHADITLSLLKCGPYKDNVVPSPKNQAPKHSLLDELSEQMSYDFINAIIEKVYKSYHETLSSLKNFLNSKYYKKKKHHIQDSMEVSHIEENNYQLLQKRPFKHELWLWGDWRDKSYKYNSPQSLIEQIQLFLNQFKVSQDIGKDIEKYHCTLFAKKDYKGVMKVYQKDISFNSSDNSIYLRIPLSHCEQAQSRVKIFQKILVLKTSNGQLIFGKLVDIAEAVESLNNKISQSGGDNLGEKPKKAKVTLTSQEITHLSSRKQKIINELQKSDELLDIYEKTIKGVGIQQVYEHMYSDKPVTIRGKSEPSFLQYISKKSGNKDITGTPFRPIGPCFYTGNTEVNFLNCPLFSQRVIQNNHPLPPIPFMPKFCHNKQTCRVYWISEKEFHYCVNSKSSGAPYSEDFYVRIFHKIVAEEDGVKITLKGGIIFINDISMKNFIKSKGESELIEVGKITLDQGQKYLKTFRGISNEKIEGNKLQKKQSEDEQNPKKQDQQMSKLKYQNKMLLIGLFAVFILNILFRLIFN